MKFAIFGNTYQAKKSSHAENLFRLLGQHNAQLCICREFHHFLTSVFVSTDAEMIEYAAKAGADRVELYTEPYATAYPKGREAAVAPFVEAAKVARSLGLGLNAGHDLSLVNLNYFYQNIPWLDEVSIGHALISDALYLGLERTVKEYKNCLR